MTSKLQALVSLTWICTVWVAAQAQETKPLQPLTSSTPSAQVSPATQPLATFKANTRLVTLEIVARDHQGDPVPGLTAGDFEVYEQFPPKKIQLLQKISGFQFVSLADLNTANRSRSPLPPGVYSNMVAMQRVPVPPTVVLMDGLNTEVSIQLQARQQMIRLLSSVSADVPMAIFLMDRQLHMVQGLTADTKLLLQAAAKIVSNKAPGPNVDPRDDPNALSANAEGMSPDRLALLQQFEHDVYSANMDTRVRETLDSLRAIARYLEGYPGRKNLLWISTSFPLSIGPDDDFGFTGMRVYKNQIEEVTKALADAKVAVYPMDPMGLKVSAASFDVSRRVGNMASPSAMGAALRHDDTTRFAEQQTMEEVAAKTGGRVCVNKNDLAECVKTAINDGTSYYELGYYPDSSDWHDEFRQITVKTKKPGIRLAYRAGYYARPEGNLQASENQSSGKPNSSKQATERVDTELQEAACNDVLISTAIIVAAQALPIDHPDYVKYMMAIDPKTMTLPQVDDGVRNLSMTVAACTFDKTGKPLQYLQHIVGAKLTEAQYAAVARHGIPHTFTVQPKAGTARVRLLVRDTFSGLMGSVEIPYGEGLRSAPMAATPVPAPSALPTPNPSSTTTPAGPQNH